ncbi:Dnajc8 protein [Thecamonas trahens ATCC 50062]|uniref:Dnajc8 protein n=1 Tax=Thecamonas trahens ATCC 50062 TaxID=461836 RepID=A0A0L0D213_THETB|nr:Dnajc8 protein [Thecamonas trahens ATCC 50062]KNC46317.1 Dnajc8 protein [Thecamonas trahens ATCC 50062]|eukprot:XP_013760610.1 Dnajc8 protein [Thecamonas trahens ATCC 50062]
MAAPAAEEGNSATIDRILQPGHKFRNLNPFWVLGIAPTTAKDELKSATAGSYDTLTSTSGAYAEFQRMVAEATAVVTRTQRKKLKAAKRERRAPSPFDVDTALQIEICNRIADAQAEAVVAKQMHEAELAARKEREEAKKRKRKAEAAFKEEWEKDRESRVSSWRKFKKRKKKLRGRKETPVMPSMVAPPAP